MPEPNFSINFTAEMLAGSTCNVGDLLVYDASAGSWKVATAANRTAAAAGAQAIALTAYGGSVVGKVSYKDSGIIPQSITGLSTGYGSTTYVRTSSTGRLERVASPSASDDVVGRAFSDGRVQFIPGFLTGSSATLGGDTPELLFLSATDTADTLEGHSRQSYGRLHVNDAVMTDGPSIDFADLGATGTITRGAGSFITDGIVAGMYAYTDGAANAANNLAGVEITNVTATVLTLATGSLVAESASAGAVSLWAQSYSTVGLAAGSYPRFGVRRSAKLENSADTNRILDSFRTVSDQHIPFTSHDRVGWAVGYTWKGYDANAGTTVRATRGGLCAATLVILTDRLTVEDDRGSVTRYFDVTGKKRTTANATPIALGLTAPGILHGKYVSAVNGALTSAAWVYDSLGVKRYQRKDAGAAAWDYDGTNVTGEAGDVDWTATGFGPIIPSPFGYIDGAVVEDDAPQEFQRLIGKLTNHATVAQTVITGLEYTMTDETAVTLDFIVLMGRRTNVTKAGRYKGSVTYRKTGGGAPQIVGAAEYGTPQETTAGDDAAFTVSGDTIRVSYTAADTDARNIGGEMRVQIMAAT